MQRTQWSLGWLRLVVYHPRISLMGWTRIPQAWSTFFFKRVQSTQPESILGGTGKKLKFTRFS